MDWQVTNVFKKNFEAKTRFVFNEGGTRSGKSFAILQIIYRICQINKNKGLIISCVSETMPHLKRGIIRDFFDVLLKPYGLYDSKLHNKTDNTYLLFGNTIEFFSVDSSDKVHGAARDILFANEIQNINYETIFQLIQRTRIQIFFDWNPTHEFWAHTQFLNNADFKEDITYIQSTYKDNHLWHESIIKDILRRAKNDINYRRVYVEGLIGSIEGLIFPDIQFVDEMPTEFKWRAFGMDFGYTNDPTTFIDVRFYQGAIYVDELIYESGLSNQDIVINAKKYYNYPDEIIADSSEKKSIDEIYSLGMNIFPTEKFAGSVNFGIQLMKNYRIFVTKKSTNVIKEFRNYKWKTDKNGKQLNEPIDDFNHAIDAIRYVCQHKMINKFEKQKVNNTYRKNRIG